MKKAGFIDLVGEDLFLDHIDEALEKAKEIA
jgi:SulP family sulfate permease